MDYLQRLGAWAVANPRAVALLAFAMFVWVAFANCLPSKLFEDSTCTVLLDREGRLLCATIADDGQYRFPASGKVPNRFEACICTYEDRYFRYHFGVNPVSVASALRTNYREGRIVRGASTITMQLARLMHKNAPRTFGNKLLEVLWAVRLEVGLSKDSILSLYAAHAPFGGNVVGLDAAAWRYYSTSAEELTWGQMAALCVLPNSPSIIYPGRNGERLRRKRDQLLHRLFVRSLLDSSELELALAEPLPEPAAALPQLAKHLYTRAIRDGKRGKTVTTTIDRRLQQLVEKVVAESATTIAAPNVSAIVASIRSGEVLAYVGNTPGLSSHGAYVDIPSSVRSSASVIKPFLYAAMLEDGLLLPNELVLDVPTKIGNFAPQNASRNFSGVVPASRALAQSLNVPIVRMLRVYGVKLFLDLLRAEGFTTFTRSADYYGLSLILGGGEISLWDLAGAYASLARTVAMYDPQQQGALRTVFPLHYVLRDSVPNAAQSLLGAGAAYLTLQALRAVSRPMEEQGWQFFSSSRSVAWKTGTSFGGRDAWTVGVNPEYVVAVWAGNHDGSSVAGLSGVRAAAPIMFNLWSLLPHSQWFAAPVEDLERVPVCAVSGRPPSEACGEVDTVYAPARRAVYAPCPYHRIVHLDSTGRWRVDASCYPASAILHRSWFILPPAAAWFYSRAHSRYDPLPPYLDGCAMDAGNRSMQFIYPRENAAVVSVPRDLDGQPSSVVFSLAHTDAQQIVYWHLDGEYVGMTSVFHQLALQPNEGKHELVVVDGDGQRASIRFTVRYRAK